jgi:hypothetical protein
VSGLRLLPSDRTFRLLLIPAVVFIASCMDRNYQTDLWHHLARGRAIVASGQLLNRDVFTYTVAGKPLQDVNWIWQVIFYRLHSWGGLPLVQVVNASLLALTFFLLVRLAWKRSGSLLASGGAALFTFLGLWQLLIIRPQTLSLLLFVLLYATLEGALTRRWLLGLAPALLAVWVNVHGGFPIGLVLVAAFVGGVFLEGIPRGEDSRGPLTRAPWQKDLLPWVLCLAGCVLATLVNPYGWRVYEYVALTSGIAPARKIDEWLPPGTGMIIGKVWVASLLILLGLLTFSPRRISRRELVLLAAFLPLACGAVRMVAWWLIVLAPILAAGLLACWPRLRDTEDNLEPRRGAALACLGLVVVALLGLPWLERINPVMALPGRAHRTEQDLQTIATHLQERQGGRIFTRFAWGEYLGWSLHPQYTVFMDGRIEIIPDVVWGQYAAVTQGRADWEEVLASYGVDTLVLDTGGYHHQLLAQVQKSSHWREEIRSGEAILFLRSSPSEDDKVTR